MYNSSNDTSDAMCKDAYYTSGALSTPVIFTNGFVEISQEDT